MSSAEYLFPALIAKRTPEVDGIVSLELQALDGSLPPFSPGSHIDLEVFPGCVRQYSLWNDPTETHRYCLGILNEPQSRGGSRAVHDRLKAGDQVRISAPKNLFALDETGTHHVLVGGGIGITPILAMAQHLHTTGASFSLHYCVRSETRAGFLNFLRSAPFADRVTLHCDDIVPSEKLDPARDLTYRAGDHLYVCGPQGFTDFVLRAAAQLNWPSEALHVERFSAEVDHTGDTFEVIAAKSGQTFTIGADQSIAQVLITAGIDVPLSCEQGVCGTCLTRVLAGIPDHRDLILTDDEKDANTEMALCCSRAKSVSLTLDI